MELTRRTLLRTTPALLAPLALLYPRRISSQAFPQPSQAVENAALAAVLAAFRNPRPGWAFERTAVALGTYFSNLDEIGYTPLLQQAFDSSGLLRVPLTWNQASLAASRISQSVGGAVNPSALILAESGLQILSSGCGAVHQMIVSAFETLGGWDSVQPFQGSELRPRDTPLPSPGNSSSSICATLTAMSLYFSVWGIMPYFGYLTFLTGGTAGLVFSAAGLAIAVASLYC